MSTQAEKMMWWREFLARRKFPSDGRYFLVPDSDEDPRELSMLNEKTLRTIPIRLGEKETVEECAAFFQTVLPNASFAVPTPCLP